MANLTYKILGECKVQQSAPPEAPSSLALTYLDIPFLRMLNTVKRLYFYEFSHSTNHFTQNTLPRLKQSLSLTLRRFFPFAGTLICPSLPHKPRIVCSAADFVTLRVVESAADFDRLVGSYGQIRHVKEFDHLVPRLPPTRFSPETDAFLFTLLGLSVAVFPNSGICIGVSYRHVVDGRTANNFMRSWASFHRGDLSSVEESLPVFDRNLIKDPSEVETVLLEQYYNLRSTWKLDLISQIDSVVSDNVRSTFLLTRENIETLREQVIAETNNDTVSGPRHLSKLILTIGLVWSCLIKALDVTESSKISSLDDKDLLHFGLPANVQHRLASPVPTNYFGNCLTVRLATATKRDLTAAETAGFVAAVRALEKAMAELKADPLEGIERRILNSTKLFESSRLVAVTGSPNLGVYGTDFGLGRVKKVEVVHFCDATCFSVAESRASERGGIEVGLALNEASMHAFSSILDRNLRRSM